MCDSLIVVIPIYTEMFNEWELLALDNNMRILHDRDVCFLIPQGLEISFLRQKYPHTKIVEVSTDWLGIKRGIKGYNEMMMSAEFYKLFLAYDYMLVCHLDAWLFRDDLTKWLEKGFDLVAAPWPMRPLYKYFPFCEYLKLRNRFLMKRGKSPRSLVWNKIGNGGLCLRRVQTFHDVCVRHSTTIALYNELNDGRHSEDVFFALEATELKTPTVEEALSFAWDVKPKLCFHLNHKKLPMGCHGFMHKSRKKFWLRFIDIHCIVL